MNTASLSRSLAVLRGHDAEVPWNGSSAEVLRSLEAFGAQASDRAVRAAAEELAEFVRQRGAASLRALANKRYGDISGSQAKAVCDLAPSMERVSLRTHPSFVQSLLEMAKQTFPRHPQAAEAVANERFAAALKSAEVEALPARKRAKLASLSAEHQEAFVDIASKANDARAVRLALADLFTDSAFSRLRPTWRRAMLKVAALYPSAEALEILRRMVNASWFPVGPAGWKYKSEVDKATLVARASLLLAYMVHRGFSCDEQKSLVMNSLAGLLDSCGAPFLEIEPLAQSESSVTCGSAACAALGIVRIVRINATLIESAEGRETLVGTVVHEMSHLANPTRNEATYSYFMDEYRAFYVGFIARHGRRPARQECYDRCEYLLGSPDAYPRIHQARLEEENGLPGPEARRIIAFMNRFRESPLPADHRMAAHTILDDRVADPDAQGPEPDPPGNLDNGPARSRRSAK